MITGKWIGVDLDGTLAKGNGWQGMNHIGEPIRPMTDRVQAWLNEGQEVRIVTARVALRDPIEILVITSAIELWCFNVFGQVLKITCSKDRDMLELWDDRCVQVEKNTGRRMDGQP